MNEALLPAALAAEARQAAAMIAGRLADDRLVDEHIERAAQIPGHPYWWGGSALYAGHAGAALTMRYAARTIPGEADRWRERSRHHLREAARHTQEYALHRRDLGTGSSGLALAIDDCARDEPGLHRTQRTMRGMLSRQVRQAEPWQEGDGADFGDYDVIRGDAGVLAYIAGVPDPDPDMRAAADVLIGRLVRMCTPGPDTGRPAWHVALKHFVRPEDTERYPHGYIDLGLAHGLPGVLAALSLARTAGYRHVELDQAIRRTAAFLLDMSEEDETGPLWPRQVRLDPSGAPERTPAEVGWMSWCYGPPGICSALLDAAGALGDDELRATAVEAFAAVLRRVRRGQGHLRTASLCHGWSGLMLVCQKFAERTDSEAARRALPDLCERVLSLCDSDHPLGVREFRSTDLTVDIPDLLDGAAGVPLALWSMADATDTRWQRALLIR